MKTRGTDLSAHFAAGHVSPSDRQPACQPGHLHLVTAQEMEEVRNALARGNVPADLEAKLCQLAQGELGHRFIAQHCRTMIALVEAAQDGAFKEASRAECERLLRVLAYVRKDDDAIPDYRIDGFADDQQEVRSVAAELGPLLQRFKAWRLRHQVPAMWTPILCAHPGQDPSHMLAPTGRLSAHAWGR